MSLLDLVIFLPLIGFLVLLLMPSTGDMVKKLAIGWAAVVFALSLGLIGPVLASPKEFQFVTNVPWVEAFKINYHVGMDGLSLWLVILTTFLTPIAMLISWKSIDHRVKEFFAFLLLLEFGMTGVFVSLDLFVFYVFWEVALVPMYFLIGIWGHDRRIYAAVKFFLYTMVGQPLSNDALFRIDEQPRNGTDQQ